MKAPFLSGERVYLNGVEKEDLPKFVAWTNDPEVTHFMFMGLVPAHIELLTEQHDQEIRNKNEVVFAIRTKKNDAVVGSAGLYQINWVSRSAEYRIVIGEKTMRGRGIGREVAGLVLRYAFEKLNFNKVWLGYNADNPLAAKSYANAGFVKEGVLRQEIYRNGKYYDAVRMSILRKEYEKKK